MQSQSQGILRAVRGAGVRPERGAGLRAARGAGVRARGGAAGRRRHLQLLPGLHAARPRHQELLAAGMAGTRPRL